MCRSSSNWCKYVQKPLQDVMSRAWSYHIDEEEASHSFPTFSFRKSTVNWWPSEIPRKKSIYAERKYVNSESHSVWAMAVPMVVLKIDDQRMFFVISNLGYLWSDDDHNKWKEGNSFNAYVNSTNSDLLKLPRASSLWSAGHHENIRRSRYHSVSPDADWILKPTFNLLSIRNRTLGLVHSLDIYEPMHARTG